MTDPPDRASLPGAAGWPQRLAPVVPYERTFDSLIGLQLTDDGSADGALRARVAIRDELRQGAGVLHGGVVAAVAESLASRGTWYAVHDQGMVVMGLSNESSFVRPLTDGHLHATAVARHRGRTRWLWEVLTHDDDGRLCVVSTVTIAVRALRSR